VAAVAFVISLLVRSYVVGTFVIVGDSMIPSLTDGERVFVNRLAYVLGRPERGDIVVFRYPLDPGREFVKRVIGLPGDRVEIRGGRVLVNGSEFTGGFQVRADGSDFAARTVPPGAVFVLGDNRSVSRDSRAFGFVPLENVEGEVFLVWWPISRVEWVGSLEEGAGDLGAQPG